MVSDDLVYLMEKWKRVMYRKPKVVSGQRRKQKEGDRKVHRDHPRTVEMESRDIHGCLHMDQPRSVGVDNGLGRGCDDPGFVIRTKRQSNL
jgi:hypothetical protein